MTSSPKFSLRHLREIGWAQWDPIGVGGPEAGWPADEYDAYLLQAANSLWAGQSVQDVASYLVSIETGHMGLTPVLGIQIRAEKVAEAIRDYVATHQA